MYKARLFYQIPCLSAIQNRVFWIFLMDCNKQVGFVHWLVPYPLAIARAVLVVLRAYCAEVGQNKVSVMEKKKD